MKVFKVTPHNLGEVLMGLKHITREQLDLALQMQRMGDRRPLGVLLVEMGYVRPADIDFALVRQKARRGNIRETNGDLLIEKAVEKTKGTTECMDELIAAAEEMTRKNSE